MSIQIIGENIHIISPKVKEAIANRDAAYFQESAVQSVVDVPLSLDTTNLNAIEAALEVARVPCIINSTSAEEERLANVPPVAKKFGATSPWST